MTDEEKRNRIGWIDNWLNERASMRTCLEYEQRFLKTLVECLREPVIPDAAKNQLRADFTNFELKRLEHTLKFWTDAQTYYEKERDRLKAELGDD